MNLLSTRIQWINRSESRFLEFVAFAFLWERIRQKIHVATGLRAKIVARCWNFCFFGREESAINSFLDSLFLWLKRIRVISRNNPFLYFAKEMHL